MTTNKTPLRGGTSKGWNYSNPNNPGYMETLEGTVVEFSQPQHNNFQTKQPEFWPDGSPKLDWCFTIRGRSGQELNWRFSPGSATKPKACRQALMDAMPEAQYVEDVLGKFIRVQTQAGTYSVQNPRPWFVTILGDGEVDKVRGSVPPVQPVVQPGQPAPGFAGAAQALQAINNQVPAQNTELFEEDEIPF